jgi:hypothetical protein
MLYFRYKKLRRSPKWHLHTQKSFMYPRR